MMRWALLCLAGLAGLAAGGGMAGIGGVLDVDDVCEELQAFEDGQDVSQDNIDGKKKMVEMIMRTLLDRPETIAKLKAATCVESEASISEDVFAAMDRVHANILGGNVAKMAKRGISVVGWMERLQEYPDAYAFVKEKATEMAIDGHKCLCGAEDAVDCMVENMKAKIDTINDPAMRAEIARAKEIFKAMKSQLLQNEIAEALQDDQITNEAYAAMSDDDKADLKEEVLAEVKGKLKAEKEKMKKNAKKLMMWVMRKLMSRSGFRKVATFMKKEFKSKRDSRKERREAAKECKADERAQVAGDAFDQAILQV